MTWDSPGRRAVYPRGGNVGDGNTAGKALRLPILDAVARIDLRKRAIADQPVQRGVDCVHHRVVAAAQAYGEIPAQFRLGVVRVHVAQARSRVAVDVPGDARGRYRARVDLALAEVCDHVAFE